ncbi:hypothetical protein CVT26_009976 [Gymnopilus dilepis]|uniref:Uncharacterized protein n=1 Tax=Gymnopilus dilepis TaxID=231916 RepID=A0A409WUR3_9AGAR|nr:hypothetical protein CVT26_009976 [Gymnopilus dilepis]
MDNLPEGVLPDPVSTSGSAMLSYDDTVAYEEQLPTAEEAERAAAASLAKRIGSSKVYLLSESSAAASRGGAGVGGTGTGTGKVPFPY